MGMGKKFGAQNVLLVSLTMMLALETGYAIPHRRDTSNIRPNNKVIVLPAVIHSPETKWGFGAGGTVAFHVGKPDVHTRTSNVQGIGLYTTRHQTIAGLDGTVYFPII